MLLFAVGVVRFRRLPFLGGLPVLWCVLPDLDPPVAAVGSRLRSEHGEFKVDTTSRVLVQEHAVSDPDRASTNLFVGVITWNDGRAVLRVLLGLPAIAIGIATLVVGYAVHAPAFAWLAVIGYAGVAVYHGRRTFRLLAREYQQLTRESARLTRAST